ncbi:hypothetical protein Esi_0098_0037 [Ectocarpus siliculosus]|uniref:Uncharacterized protein n=1 Tax=Ectocarpus siliculosus TaxID=2880 RepID=D7G9F6_ECTSI|nr:hypothetical protein Esi_0098_0037 [Ectocarpus siliculosus]|eukprot:CBJ28296.1 hypothetical protein Esi_0098_0037 [Ectocarpus siliculosus]
MHTKEKIRAMRDRLPYSSSDRPPTTTIYSCEQFPFDRNPVVGVLIIEGNIVCKNKRTLVVSERAYLFSHMDEVHLEGVHFIVEENAALGIAVATLHVEKLEGDSGEIFTIDPGGFLGGHADHLRPLPENGTKSPFSPDRSAEYTYEQRLGLNPTHLMILALADSGQATDDKVLHMMARSERLRVWQKETATDMEVDLEKCARGFDELLRAKKRERDLQMEKEEEEEKEAEKTTMPQQQADPTTAAVHSSDPKQEHAGQDASSTSTSTSTSGRGKTKAKAKAVPATVTRYWGDEARRYWGDDVALKVTNTGDVLVTVGDLVVVQKRNPMWTKKKESWLQRKVAKSKPVKKIKDVFGRLGRRGKGNGKTDNKARSDDDDDSKGNGDGAPVSTMYSLHVVENGLEVRLEGVFMWGWYAE